MPKLELYRKCFKCGCSPAEQNVKLFRFPKPGLTNNLKCSMWASFMFPNEPSTTELHRKLHSEHRMLCDRHFIHSDFIDLSKRRIMKYAVPSNNIISETTGHQRSPLNEIKNLIQSSPIDVAQIEPVPGHSGQQESIGSVNNHNINGLPPIVERRKADRGIEKDKEISINYQEFGVQGEQTDSYEMDSFDYTQISDLKTEEQYGECTLAVCRLCLLQTDKLYHMDKHNLRVHCEELFGRPLPSESLMPQTLCSVCVRLLAKCVDFKQKCERAQYLLEELTNDGHQITEAKLSMIDRDKEGFVRLNISLQLIDDFVNVTDPSKDDGEDQSEAGASCVNLVAIVNDQVFVSDIDQSETKKKVIDEELFNTMESQFEYDYNIGDEHFFVSDIDQPETKKKVIDEELFNTKDSQFEYDDNIGDDLFVQTEVVVSKSRKKQKKVTEKRLDTKNWMVLAASEEEIIKGIEARKNSDMFKMAAYKCYLCFRAFLNQEALKNHMYFHSQDRGEFECEYCRLSFAKESFKRTHVSRQHHYSYRCRRCHYRCTTSENAHRHDDYHDKDHQDDFSPGDVCSLDSSTGVSAYPSRKPRLRHSINAPTKSYCCLCNKAFATNLAYIRHHKQEHAGMPPAGRYMCGACGAKYVSNYQLEYHRRQHAGSLPYACQRCPRRFRLQSQLSRHTCPREECSERLMRKAGVEKHRRLPRQGPL